VELEAQKREASCQRCQPTLLLIDKRVEEQQPAPAVDSTPDSPLVREYWESGKAEGMSAILLRLLEFRFGPVPEWAQTRLHAASADQLLTWSTAALRAESLQYLLGS
jgi:hypothetical protein